MWMSPHVVHGSKTVSKAIDAPARGPDGAARAGAAQSRESEHFADNVSRVEAALASAVERATSHWERERAAEALAEYRRARAAS